MPAASKGGGAELEPMYATTGREVPEGEGWAFEPKWDGVRVLAHADAQRARLVTRNGKEKTRQFPEIVEALRALAEDAGAPVVLDGEVVALEDGEPARFQRLQGRMHLKGERDIRAQAAETPAALIAFDLLRQGDQWLLERPWTARRERLEALLGGREGPRLRLGETRTGRGEALLREARREGWEGVIAKRTDSTYRPGRRADEWRKLKVEFRQELVVGGWTEPRRTRPYLGALLLGYYDDDRLVYAGRAGGGFTHQGLREMLERLQRIERKTPPFADPPRTGEAAHWVRPEVVVEVRFSEWTRDGKLRQPIVLGVRDDKPAREVTRESVSAQGAP